MAETEIRFKGQWPRSVTFNGIEGQPVLHVEKVEDLLELLKAADALRELVRCMACFDTPDHLRCVVCDAKRVYDASRQKVRISP